MNKLIMTKIIIQTRIILRKTRLSHLYNKTKIIMNQRIIPNHYHPVNNNLTNLNNNNLLYDNNNHKIT
jgi:hypothetical protein